MMIDLESRVCPLNKLTDRLISSVFGRGPNEDDEKKSIQVMYDIISADHIVIISADHIVQTSNGEVSEWLWSVVQV